MNVVDVGRYKLSL